ncbi:MAG: hypothetical protein GJV46_16020 [Geobacter sp.]|nr:hypothetical protein [Geobacter sp.]
MNSAECNLSELVTVYDLAIRAYEEQYSSLQGAEATFGDCADKDLMPPHDGIHTGYERQLQAIRDGLAAFQAERPHFAAGQGGSREQHIAEWRAYLQGLLYENNELIYTLEDAISRG